MRTAKRAAIGAALVVLAAPALRPADLRLSVSAGYQAVFDATFKDVYGSGGLMLNGALGLEIAPSFEARLEVSYFGVTGATTVTDEETTFSLVPLAAGLRFRPGRGRIQPYAGAGLDVCLYKERGPERFEPVSGSSLGFHAEAGLSIDLGGPLFLDLNVRYLFAKASPFEEKIQVGGLRGGVGLGIKF